ncbi:hypothetical protein EJ06DRAFT_575059 [Trichodelitschia bisporula]|uniref:STB6-like N-terminal domain-containing protein n=1 Tax=Trichodelitschia bisporula TaxID=703511 RepID=A0A6G1I194_9PEZI|nr:hypothetical protein EJ06DRAFT_575059 [Trichodelitschia bisporula]
MSQSLEPVSRVPSKSVTAASSQTAVGSAIDFAPKQTLSTSTFAGPDPTMEKPTHQRFVLTDPDAFSYLAADRSTKVLARDERLEGYECYLVEQWACSRSHPTFVITTYTGDLSRSVVVNVLSVPTDEEAWSTRLTVYFKAMSMYHARRRETRLGTLMITNLSGFPSSLTVIPVPDGNVATHTELFIVNENLKRMGCSGRVGMTLTKPSSAVTAKFYQLYRVSEKVPVNEAVKMLVKLCQIALVLFDKLETEYADGLLCDPTETAINDWWADFGTEYHPNIEPHDGILGPTTVAALLGLLTGARNRLDACRAPVTKDVFDMVATKRAILYFQRSQGIERTRRLDRRTMNKLHRVTAKAASSEGWGVPRAVKSTVAELGGKGGEMVMDMVGGREKARINDVETVDVDQFVSLIHGATSKYLWKGKTPKKGTTTDAHQRLGEHSMEFQSDERGGYEWSSRRKGTGGFESRADAEGDVDRNRIAKKHTGSSSTNHQKHDGSRGFGRIKDAVGLRHSNRSHKDGDLSDRRGSIDSNPADPSKADPDATTRQPAPPIYAPIISDTPISTPFAFPSNAQILEQQPHPPPPPSAPSRSPSPSLAPSSEKPDIVEPTRPLLQRTQSASDVPLPHLPVRDARWPRHLSFSLAADAVLTWEPPTSFELSGVPLASMAEERAWAEFASLTQERVVRTERDVGSWVARQIEAVRGVDAQAAEYVEELNVELYRGREEQRGAGERARRVMDGERGQLREQVREIEVLDAKLEYEVGVFGSKVEDMEEEVAELERYVVALEEECKRLEEDMRPREGWVHWGLRVLTGVGKMPEEGT